MNFTAEAQRRREKLELMSFTINCRYPDFILVTRRQVFPLNILRLCVSAVDL